MTQTDTTWNSEAAAHLARRAGFGARPDELAKLVALGREAAIAQYLDFPRVNDALEREMYEIGGTLTDFGEGAGANASEVGNLARASWIYRMVREANPLREKLTLFWHDHFACQRTKIIRLRQYMGQIETFRLHTIGSFRELLIAVAQDGGMLAYLDNRLSDARNPNENWARELLELFTLGVDNGYEQRDVYELARVFTGWTSPDLNSDEFVYDPAMHDSEDKILFGEPIKGRSGEAGMQEGIEAIDRILAKPECANYLAEKLIAWFANHEPTGEQVREIARAFRESNYSIRTAVEAIFSSEWFFAPANRSNRFKNPIELVVSAAHLLELQNPHLAELENHSRTLGMDLFEPPSVAGWDHGSAWINSGSTISRAQFALHMSALPTSSLRVTGSAAIDLDGLAVANENDAQLVARLSKRLLQDELPEHRVIEGYLAQFEAPARWSADQVRYDKVRAVLHLLLTSPRFAVT